MKDKEMVKKFLSNTYINCQKRYKKNQVIKTMKINEFDTVRLLAKWYLLHCHLAN